MEALTPHWFQALRRAGYEPGRVLGFGMEGTVVELGGDLVAKVWHRRAPMELRTLQVFYAEVAQSCPLATPRIHRILSLEGRGVTVEARLPGRSLRAEPLDQSPDMTDSRIETVVRVLEALAAVPATPRLTVLPVLQDRLAFDISTGFRESLARLVERRVGAHRTSLASALPDLDRITGAVVRVLADSDHDRRGLVHGDLVPDNVLVDESTGHASAILDFGFLSTVGDPAFDAAVAASVHDMYGPEARLTEAVLDAAIIDRFGYDPFDLAIYRAAFALATSNCFSASGSDGHFAWCIAMLRRDDVTEALEL